MVDVKPREIINPRIEPVWLLLIPLLERFQRAEMAKYPLGKVAMVDLDLALKGVRQVFPGAEAVGRQNLADATVKAFDKVHGSGLVSGDYRSTVTDNSDPHQSPFWIKAVGLLRWE